MDPTRFDRIARFVGSGQSRRRMLKTLAGGALGAMAAAVGIGEAAATTRTRSVGNACTTNADCASGLCVQEGRTRKICHCTGAADCPAAKDVCHSAACLDSGYCGFTVNVDARCDDGNPCTINDVCQANGSCKGVPFPCPTPDQCHTAGTCNPTTGICSNPAKPDNTACNDNNACTQTATCQGGTCTGGNPVVCVAQDQCHTAGVCDHATGLCTNPAKPDNTACNDNNACTQTDTCQAGVCTGSNPVVCAAQDQCHTAGTCNPATGTCSNPAKPDNTACNDNNACTQTDSCQNGTCVGSNPIVCPSGTECVNGGCFKNFGEIHCTGCSHPPCTICAGSVDGSGNYLCANFTGTACSSNADCPVGEACAHGGANQCISTC